MAEEFGTVNVKRGDPVQTELLRRHYRAHRDSLARLVADAPSEHLAGEYQRLIGEIDAYLHKLGELAGRTGSIADTNPMMRTGPGTRPLVRSQEPSGGDFLPSGGGAPSRIAMIVVAGFVVLGIIGWLIWRASSEPKTEPPIVEQPVTTTTAAPPPAVTPAPPPAPALKITPAVADYGVVRRGTRAVRQFEITNAGAAPLEIEVTRSSCHCLYYDYVSRIPAMGKESITVTIDATRVKAGPLREQIDVHGRKDRSAKAEFAVQAAIQ